jgi:hypothetical protein
MKLQDASARTATIAAMAKIDKEKNDDGESWFAKGKKMLTTLCGDDSGQTIAVAQHQTSRALQNFLAKNFISSLHDPKNSQHNTNLSLYKSHYNSSIDAVERAYMAKADEESSPELYKKDENYERAVKNKYCNPQGNVTREQIAFAKILSDSLEASRYERGYGPRPFGNSTAIGKFDDEIVQAHLKKYF